MRSSTSLRTVSILRSSRGLPVVLDQPRRKARGLAPVLEASRAPASRARARSRRPKAHCRSRSACRPHGAAQLIGIVQKLSFLTGPVQFPHRMVRARRKATRAEQDAHENKNQDLARRRRLCGRGCQCGECARRRARRPANESVSGIALTRALSSPIHLAAAKKRQGGEGGEHGEHGAKKKQGGEGGEGGEEGGAKGARSFRPISISRSRSRRSAGICWSATNWSSKANGPPRCRTSCIRARSSTAPSAAG